MNFTDVIFRPFFDAEADTGSGSTETTTDTESNVETDTDDSKSENKETKDDKDKKYTDEDVDKIINKKFARMKKQAKDEVRQEVEADLKKSQDIAKKYEDMTDKEKYEHDLAERDRKIKEYELKETRSEMAKTIRGELKDKGLVGIGDSIINALIDPTDADETKIRTEEFYEAFSAEVERIVKEKLKGTSPVKGSGNTSKTLTKEEILKEKDDNKKKALIVENKHLFPEYF